MGFEFRGFPPRKNVPKPFENFAELKEKTDLDIRYVEEDDGSVIVSLCRLTEATPETISSESTQVKFEQHQKKAAGTFYQDACQRLKKYASPDLTKEEAITEMTNFFESEGRK